MAKPPPEDPRITDLRRYRKEREQAAKRKPNPKAQMRETILGANPRAGLILALLAAGLLAYAFLPTIIALIRR
jgi:hypothetical protein